MIKEGEKRAMGVTGNRADGGGVGRPTEVGWAGGRGGRGGGGGGWGIDGSR